MPTPARYIPIEIAPFGEHAILTMVEKFTEVMQPENAERVKGKIGEIRHAIQTNRELSDLLSRPVHVPMFATILPGFETPIADLNRAFLYETFIKRILSREVIRLPDGYRGRYSTDQRFKFAKMLALQMARRGEARSIRRSEIPAETIAPFVNQGESLEIARRDLLAACFLDQKPTDILTFGHKSFLEFLVAYQMLEIMRDEPANVQKIELPNVTFEIAGFAVDLASIEDVAGFVETSDQSREFLADFLWQAFRVMRIAEHPPRRANKIPSGSERGWRRSGPELEVVASKKAITLYLKLRSEDLLSRLAAKQLSLKARARLSAIFVLGQAALGRPHGANERFGAHAFQIGGPECARFLAIGLLITNTLSLPQIEKIGQVKVGRRAGSTTFISVLFDHMNRCN
jgi:hypothetical protein